MVPKLVNSWGSVANPWISFNTTWLAAGQTNTFSLQITVLVAEADEAPINAVAATAAISVRPNTLIDLTLLSLLGAESAEVLR